MRAIAVWFWIHVLSMAACARPSRPQVAAPAAPAPQTAHTAELERVDALLEPLLAAHDVPALGGAVIELEKGLVGLGAVGVRERGKDVRVTVDDRWHLGSCTKAMTATLAARLVAKGKLDFATTVGEAFPELKKDMHEAWRGVKLEWLLQNRGGAPGKPPQPLWLELYGRDKDPVAARRWFVEKLLESEPESEPGTKFEYSNQGFMIAGAMLEARTGKDWESLMRSELFEPLGMSSAGFGPPGSAAELDQPRGHNPKPAAPGPRADNPRALGPAGTVHASLHDWSKFVHEHLRGAAGQKGFLPSGLFEQLHTPPNLQAYAMGWGRSSRPWAGGDVLTHSGSNTMWFCVVWIAPEKGVALLATCNEGGDKGQKACDAAIVAMAKARGLM
jgi:CubicO group peptidase (beta-lactamase class C family)